MLSASQIAEAVRDAIPRVACALRPDALAALRAAAAAERSERGRAVLEQLLLNAEIAERDSVPLCQDTGTVWVRIELGAEECLCGDLQSEIDAAVALAFREAKLRMSVVRNALFDRTNTDTNTPAFIEVVHAAQSGHRRHRSPHAQGRGLGQREPRGDAAAGSRVSKAFAA